MNPKKLWNKNFLFLWLGQAQSSCGGTLYTIALAYLVLEITGSPKYMAQTMAIGTIPYIVSPFVGAIIDKRNMKPYLVLGDIVRCLCMLVVAYLLFIKALTISIIMGSAFITSLVGVIYSPTFASILPKLVPPSDIARANAFNSLSGQISMLFGFAFGGVLVSYIGVLYAIFINACTFLVMSVLLSFIEFPDIKKPMKKVSIWKEVKEGFLYLYSTRGLLTIPIIFFVMEISYAPLEILMPIKLKTLAYGAEGYGIFFTCLLLGSILISMFITKVGKELNVNRYSFLGLMIMAFSIISIAVVNNFLLNCVSSFFYGMGSCLVSISSITFVQTTVIDRYRGRIFSLFSVIERCFMPIALVGISKLIDLMNFITIFCLTGLVLLATSLIWILTHREKNNGR